MYKKITHNIVEEHFDMPAQVDPNIVKSTLVPKMTENEFKTEIINYFDSYNKKVNKIIESTTGTEEEMVKAETAAFENIDALGNLFKRAYTLQTSEAITQHMRATILSMIQAAHLLRIGTDIKTWSNNRFNLNLGDSLGRILRDANNDWSYQTVKDLYVKIISAWLSQTKARVAKNSTLEQEQAVIARETLMTLADAIANGIIKQHPELFSITATTMLAKPKSYQSDIM